jgi:hypothetical protein
MPIIVDFLRQLYGCLFAFLDETVVINLVL